MKEFTAIARNLFLAVDEESGGVMPNVELVFTVSEPVSFIDDDDILARRRELSDLRMVVSVSGLKLITATMLDIMESMERLGIVPNVEPEDEPATDSDKVE